MHSRASFLLHVECRYLVLPVSFRRPEHQVLRISLCLLIPTCLSVSLSLSLSTRIDNVDSTHREQCTYTRPHTHMKPYTLRSNLRVCAYLYLPNPSRTCSYSVSVFVPGKNTQIVALGSLFSACRSASLSTRTLPSTSALSCWYPPLASSFRNIYTCIPVHSCIPVYMFTRVRT